MAENLVIAVRHGDVEHALGAMSKLMLKDGLFKEMKKRAYYEKPSVKRKRKQAEARKKRLKAERKRALSEDRRENYLLRYSRKGTA
jgi:small subunit ribosomal protein S21